MTRRELEPYDHGRDPAQLPWPPEPASWRIQRAAELERLVIELADALVGIGNAEAVFEALRDDQAAAAMRVAGAMLRDRSAGLTSDARQLRADEARLEREAST